MRIQLTFPNTTHFTAHIPIRVTDINYGKHLANDAVLSILHEARVQFFHHFGFDELNVAGIATIMSDVAIVYRSEAFHPDTLQIDMAVSDFMRVGFDLYYRCTSVQHQKEIAVAKTHMVFFDYDQKRVRSVPAAFQRLFE